MIRARSLATSCVATVTRRTSVRVGGGRAAPVAVRRFSERNLRSAQPLPSDTAESQMHVDGLSTISPEHDDPLASEMVKDVGELLRQQTCAREDWEIPTVLSDSERRQLARELVLELQHLKDVRGVDRTSPVIQLLEEGRRKGIKDIMVYHAVMKQLLKNFFASKNAQADFEAVLDKMEEDGLQPDLKTFHQTMEFHAFTKNSEKALAVYEEVLSRGLKPTDRTLSIIVLAHARGGNYSAMRRTADEAYAKGWKLSRAAYIGMINLMGQQKDNEGVIETMRRMRTESKRPIEATFVAAFRAVDNLGQCETARELFQHRTEIGLPPSEYAFVKMMVVLNKAGRAEECLEYWRQLVCVNGLNGLQISPATYNFAIKCAASVGNLEEIEAVLAMMESQGIVPTESTYAGAVGGFTAAGDPRLVQGLRRAFEAIGRTGPPPPVRLVLAKGVLHAHAEMWEEAVDTFSSVLAESHKFQTRDWKCLLMSHSKMGQHSLVKEAWALSTQHPPEDEHHRGNSYSAFLYALQAARELEDPAWALELRESARKAKRLSIDINRTVVDIMLTSGRLEDARAILKELERWTLGRLLAEHFEGAYHRALALCEKRGDAKLALDFFDGMRSARPPLSPLASCPSSLFVRESLRENGRSEEIGQQYLDESCAPSSAMDATTREAPELPGSECHELAEEARDNVGESQAERAITYAGDKGGSVVLGDEEGAEQSARAEGNEESACSETCESSSREDMKGEDLTGSTAVGEM